MFGTNDSCHGGFDANEPTSRNILRIPNGWRNLYRPAHSVTLLRGYTPRVGGNRLGKSSCSRPFTPTSVGCLYLSCLSEIITVFLALTLQGIVGNLSSGKSALVHRYLTGTYVQEESPEGKSWPHNLFFLATWARRYLLWAKRGIVLGSSCSLKLDKTCKISQKLSTTIQRYRFIFCRVCKKVNLPLPVCGREGGARVWFCLLSCVQTCGATAVFLQGQLKLQVLSPPHPHPGTPGGWASSSLTFSIYPLLHSADL